MTPTTNSVASDTKSHFVATITNYFISSGQLVNTKKRNKEHIESAKNGEKI